MNHGSNPRRGRSTSNCLWPLFNAEYPPSSNSRPIWPLLATIVPSPKPAFCGTRHFRSQDYGYRGRTSPFHILDLPVSSRVEGAFSRTGCATEYTRCCRASSTAACHSDQRECLRISCGARATVPALHKRGGAVATFSASFFGPFGPRSPGPE